MVTHGGFCSETLQAFFNLSKGKSIHCVHQARPNGAGKRLLDMVLSRQLSKCLSENTLMFYFWEEVKFTRTFFVKDFLVPENRYASIFRF